MSAASHPLKQPGVGVEPRSATHQSLTRGLRLIEAVAFNGGALSLAEAARRTGLHRSTAHHLLQTLVSLGYLRQDLVSRDYDLAARPFQLTGRTPSPELLGRLGQPVLEELSRRSGEGSSLAVYRDGVVTIAAKRDHEGPVRVVQDLGAERAIHCTAVGKAIAPWLPPGVLAGVLARDRFERHTAKTLTTRAALEAEFRRIRAAGYAIDDEEHLEGIRCIAVPVFGHAGQVVASMCVVGPKSRMTHRQLRALRVPLLELAGALSKQLGWDETNGVSAPGRAAGRAPARTVRPR
jgi:DNA-binding IclR family transcriptional regulator